MPMYVRKIKRTQVVTQYFIAHNITELKRTDTYGTPRPKQEIFEKPDQEEIEKFEPANPREEALIMGGYGQDAIVIKEPIPPSAPGSSDNDDDPPF